MTPSPAGKMGFPMSVMVVVVGVCGAGECAMRGAACARRAAARSSSSRPLGRIGRHAYAVLMPYSYAVLYDRMAEYACCLLWCCCCEQTAERCENGLSVLHMN
eukprot:COSAG01_NODE_2122_length_8373_cov_4.387962_2_plen_103_part_00